MAPTETFSEQHWRKFNDWLAPLGVRIARLHGGLSKKQKKPLLEAISSGEMHIVIGTHALVQEGVDSRASRSRWWTSSTASASASGSSCAASGRSLAAPADDERDSDPAHVSMTYYAI